MARSEAGRLLTIQHRQRQVALRAAVLRDLGRLWPLWGGSRVSQFDDFADPATALVRDRFVTSAGLAVAFYQALRTAEGVRGAPQPRLAEPPPADKVVGNLRATGLAGTMRGVRAGFSPQAARQSGLVQAMGSVGRMVMRGAAETLVLSSAADPRSRGWQRVTSGSACPFCTDLEGVVFASSDRADFQSHDHCACSAEPVF